MARRQSYRAIKSIFQNCDLNTNAELLSHEIDASADSLKLVLQYSESCNSFRYLFQTRHCIIIHMKITFWLEERYFNCVEALLYMIFQGRPLTDAKK